MSRTIIEKYIRSGTMLYTTRIKEKKKTTLRKHPLHILILFFNYKTRKTKKNNDAKEKSFTNPHLILYNPVKKEEKKKNEKVSKEKILYKSSSYSL